MNRQALYFVIGLVLACTGSFLAGYNHRKVEIKEVIRTETKIEIQYKDKIVERQKIVVRWRQAKNVTVTTHEEHHPDGTTTKDTIVTDKTVTTNGSSTTSSKVEAKVEATKETQTVEKIKEIKTLVLPDWFVQAGAGVLIRTPELGSLPRSGIYTVSVSRRILWSCYLGLQGQSDPLFNHPAAFALMGCGF